jgi:hypothetical protein
VPKPEIFCGDRQWHNRNAPVGNILKRADLNRDGTMPRNHQPDFRKLIEMENAGV